MPNDCAVSKTSLRRILRWTQRVLFAVAGLIAAYCVFVVVDAWILKTFIGEYRYRVVSTKIVRPDNIAVLDSGGIEILTLVTRYPFYFVGSAPNRFIVRAERIA